MRTVLLYISLTFMFGCQSFQTATLPEDKPLVHYSHGEDKVEAIMAQDYNNGVLDNFKKGISRWNVSHSNAMGINIAGDTLNIFAKGVGPNWEEFYRDVPPLNFSEAKIIVIRARIDSWQVPLIRLDLIDKAGRITNAKPQMAKIIPNSGFQDYVFRYNGAFTQNWPNKDVVDSTQITRLRFNINGGKQTPYSGDIYFDEIKVVQKYP